MRIVIFFQFPLLGSCLKGFDSATDIIRPFNSLYWVQGEED